MLKVIVYHQIDCKCSSVKQTNKQTKNNFLGLKAAQKEVEDKIWAHEPWFLNVWARSMYQHDIEYKHILPKETYTLMPFL